jgi:hypothetical protein
MNKSRWGLSNARVDLQRRGRGCPSRPKQAKHASGGRDAEVGLSPLEHSEERREETIALENPSLIPIAACRRHRLYAWPQHHQHCPNTINMAAEGLGQVPSFGVETHNQLIYLFNPSWQRSH